MTELLPWIVAILGLALMALQLSRRWPGWVGFPFLIITGFATLAAGISPLFERIVESNLDHYELMGIPGYYSDEVQGAIGLVLLNYGSLLLGMWAVYIISGLVWGKRPSIMPGVSYRGSWFDPITTKVMWRTSLALFVFGVLCHAVVAYKLVQVAPITAWSSNRATLIFPHGGHGGIYKYALDLSDTMLIGGWGLLIFAASSRARLIFAVAANGLFPAWQVLLGSRVSLIASLYAAVLVYHFGVRPLRRRHWLGILAMGLVALSLLTVWRYDINQSQEALQKVAETLLVPRSISEAVWALRNWPDKIPFFGGEVTLRGWQLMFPTARFVEARSTWQFMVDLFYGGRLPDGFSQGGGIHFSFPVEQYIDLGYIGLIGIGILYGIMLGGLYEWQARQRNNPFLLLLAVAATNILIAAFDGKMAWTVGGFFFFRLLPIGLMALLTGGLMTLLTGRGVVGQHWWARSLLAALYGVVMCYLLRFLTGLDLFSYLLASFLGLSYICSLFVVHVAGETNLSWKGSQESRNPVW